jgi:single-strand DNA-binding protein
MGINRVVVQGNLTRDVEVKQTVSGSSVAQASIAVNRKWKNKSTGEMQDEVSFIDLVMWGRTAEIAAQYTQKGTNILVEGRLKQDQWQDKDTGANRSKIQVVVDQLHLQPRSQQSDGGPQYSQDHSSQPPRQQAGYGDVYADSGTGDDIPF